MTSNGDNILYFPPILIPDSNVPLPSILALDFTTNTEGFDDIKSTMVDSPSPGDTVLLSK